MGLNTTEIDKCIEIFLELLSQMFYIWIVKKVLENSDSIIITPIAYFSV